MAFLNRSQELRKKESEKDKKIFFRNRTVTIERDYSKLAESTKRIRKNRVTDKMTPLFYKLLYENIICKKACRENRLYYKGRNKYWLISESKIAERLGVSKTTARKLLNCAETEGIIKRGYLNKTHALAESIGITLTNYGKEMLKAEFYIHKKTAKYNNSISEIYNYHNDYKSCAHEITFKNENNITAKVWHEYRYVTGRFTEQINKPRSKFLHFAINLLGKQFNLHSTEQKIDALKAYIKHQWEYLRNSTFFNMFSLKSLWAYIYKLKRKIFAQEQEASEQKKVTPIVTPVQNVPPQKLPENKSFSSNPNIIVNNNISVQPKGLQSLGNLMTSFLNSFPLKE